MKPDEYEIGRERQIGELGTMVAGDVFTGFDSTMNREMVVRRRTKGREGGRRKRLSGTRVPRSETETERDSTETDGMGKDRRNRAGRGGLFPIQKADEALMLLWKELPR